MNTPTIPKETRKQMAATFRRAGESLGIIRRSPDTPANFTLNFGEDYEFEYGARAYYRMGLADRPFDLKEIADPGRSYAALVTWLWACLGDVDCGEFDTAEDFAAMIPPDRIMDCSKAFFAAVKQYSAQRAEVNAGAQPKTDTPANG